MRQVVQRIFEDTLEHCVSQGLLPAEVASVEVQIDAPRQALHGDWATNLAMVLQKRAHRKPRDLAEILVKNLQDPDQRLRSVEIAGPGFINVSVAPEVWFEGLRTLLERPTSFGQSQAGKGEKVMVEFVSANPTGPLHVGHGRGAVVGDVLCNLLQNAGYSVSREYYINNAGGQIEVLGVSLYLRYAQLFGRPLPGPDGTMPEGHYPGEYLVDIARKLEARHGDRFLDRPEDDWRSLFTDFAMGEILAGIREDLRALGVHFDTYFEERTLHHAGAVEAAIEVLKQKGHVELGTLPPPKGKEVEDYVAREQWIFKGTAFGDDRDSGLQKADGSYTYFAGDIAYHLDKLSRGFHTVINVWGADHSGAVKRLQAAVDALSGRKGALEVVLIQMVNLYRDGKPVRMGKRKGTVVSLREILDEVGADAVRVFFTMRSASTTLDFDLSLAGQQRKENPVFYVQYGHARIASILRNAAEKGYPPPRYDLALLQARLVKPEERELLKLALDWPEVVAGAARAREPHRVVFYMQELIAGFHSYYARAREDASYKVVSEDRELTAARLLWCQGLQTVLRNALGVLGVSAPEHMAAPDEE
jgi:arginyl-tRNA synthetase